MTETHVQPTQIVAPKVAPTAPVTKPITNLAAQVNQVQGKLAPRPASLKSGSTKNVLDESYFRGVLYSETSARKTVTAARFAGGVIPGLNGMDLLREQLKRAVPHTRFILSRPEDQLIPLDGYEFKYEYCPDHASLDYVLRYPDQVWPELFNTPDPEKKRTIIVDDINQCISAVLGNVDSRDGRKVYGDGLKDFENMVQPLTRKPCNLILVSLANLKESRFTGNEQIGPMMSDGFRAYVTASFAAVLYVNVKNWKLLTERDTFVVEGEDDKGKTKTYSREIFAKVKGAVKNSSDPAFLIRKEEELDLSKLWNKIRGIK